VPFPRTIAGRLRQPVVKAKREDVEKPPDADPPDFARDARTRAAAALADDDGAGEGGEGATPARQPLAVEIGALVADEQSSHVYRL